MRSFITAASVVLLAVSAVQAAPPSVEQTPPTAGAAQSAGALARAIRDVVIAGRERARRDGLSNDAAELAIAQAVETLIAESGADPAVVAEALRLALAEERCVLDDDGAWSQIGCAALDRIARAVTAALVGPAATGGTGGVPSVTGGPPPGGGGGSDYSNN